MRAIFVFAAMIGATCCGNAIGDGILSTKHNLSVTGPGDIKAVSETRVCIFCHTPHHASPVTPLWSRPLSTTVYELYASSTLLAKPGQPTGASKLCLSCHDGTIALGQLYGSQDSILFVGGITNLPADRQSNLKTDLSNDHPISFAYTQELAIQRKELRDPSTLPLVLKLEDGQLLQCTTCHNPHKDPYGKFLVMSNSGSALCISCHIISGWESSAHAVSATTANDACGTCHVSHTAGARFRLLKKQVEEDNCFPCHRSGGVGVNVQSDFSKIYRHPVDLTTGVHDPMENPLKNVKHVECADCHNSHRTKVTASSYSGISAVLSGVNGVNASGAVVAEATHEYEICFKCHAESSFTEPQVVPRQVNETNTRLQFATANPSYHPVTDLGKGTSVPSLRPGYSTSSIIQCSDCHGSDNGPKDGGSGAGGVHGSIYPHILVARYEQDTYPLTYLESNYALCFRCHDQNILLDPSRSPFPPHNSHVVNHRVPCSVCHDAHGVSAALGASVPANAHLINFDTRFVTSASYDSISRSCTVSCHLANPKTY